MEKKLLVASLMGALAMTPGMGGVEVLRRPMRDDPLPPDFGYSRPSRSGRRHNGRSRTKRVQTSNDAYKRQRAANRQRRKLLQAHR